MYCLGRPSFHAFWVFNGSVFAGDQVSLIVISMASSKDRLAQSVDQLQCYKITDIVHALWLVKNRWCIIPVNWLKTTSRPRAIIHKTGHWSANNDFRKAWTRNNVLTQPHSLLKSVGFYILILGFAICCCHSFKVIKYNDNVKSQRKTTTMWISGNRTIREKRTRFVPTINKTDSSSILELVFCQNWIWMNGIVTKRSDHVPVQNQPLRVVNRLIAACGKWMKSSFTLADIRQSKQNYCEGDRLNKTQLRIVWCSIFCFCINHCMNEFFKFDFPVMNVCWLFLYTVYISSQWVQKQFFWSAAVSCLVKLRHKIISAALLKGELW